MTLDLHLLRGIILPPDLNQLALWGPLTVSLEYLVWAFLGVVLVSTLLAVAVRRLQPALADDLAHVVPARLGPWLALGLLPLTALVFLYGQLVHGTRFDLADALLLASPAALGGLAIAFVYRHWAHPAVGGLAVLALLGFITPFAQWMAQLAWPELWPLVNPLLPDIYNVQAVIRILIFLTSALLVTGATLLFVYFLWPERRLPVAAPHGLILARLALVLVLAGSLAIAALVVWDAAVLPFGARSFAGLKWAGGVIGVAWLTTMLALGRLLDGHQRGLIPLCVCAALVLGLELGREHVVRFTALADHLAIQRLEAANTFAALKEKQETLYTSNQPLGPQAGAQIYQERCSACHAFDRKVVGPAHRDVLPKYKGDPDRLMAFILNPVKVDPAFPPMAKPGLSRREAQAVADYLLAEFQKQSP